MNVEVVVDGLEDNPQCLHGPSLLFRKNGPETKEYYACSVSRDHKECPFYLEASKENLKKLKNVTKWVSLRADTIKSILDRKPYKKYLKILKSFKMKDPCCESTKVRKKSASQSKKISKPNSNLKIKKNAREMEINALDCVKIDKCDECVASAAYCHSCDQLIESNDIKSHSECKLRKDLTEHQLKHPTEILIPLEDSKTHAQYFFSKETVKNIVLLLSRINAERILCIGTPRIHEYLINDYNNKVKSLLLDIDLKYYNFYSQKQFIWYNMFNNYVLKEDGFETLKEFLHSENTVVLLDPPFGGRVEPLAFTVNALDKLYCEVNGFTGRKCKDQELSDWK